SWSSPRPLPATPLSPRLLLCTRFSSTCTSPTATYTLSLHDALPILGPRELAAAHRTGRLLRLPGEVILLPRSAALAMRELAELPQPFTASAARQALGTTRRVMIPLLEHLDARGWTRRLADSRREVVR